MDLLCPESSSKPILLKLEQDFKKEKNPMSINLINWKKLTSVEHAAKKLNYLAYPKKGKYSKSKS